MKGKLFGITVTSITVLEFLSYLGYLADPINHVMFWILVIGMGLLTWWRLEYGLWVVLAELVIGSKGYIFSFPVSHFQVSIRLAFFLILVALWLSKLIQTKHWNQFKNPYTVAFILLILTFIYSASIGVLNHNSTSQIFLDANGYLFFGLFFVFISLLSNKQRVLQALEVMLAAVTTSVLKTFFLLFVFSHQLFPFITPMYRWVRFTGVGEITQLSNGFYRIFFQSHIYEVFAYFFLLILLCLVPFKPRAWGSWVPMAIRWMACGSVIIITLSRSFWLALVCGLLVLTSVARRRWHWSWKKLMISGILFCLGSGIQLGALAIIVNIPLPNTTGVSISSLVQDRTSNLTQEDAGASRFALLKPLLARIAEHPVWGRGFGTTVSYQSHDQRAIASSNGGLYTTFSFEWGYLDLWLKLGALGTFLFGIFIWTILRRGWEAWKKTRTPVDEIVVFGTFLSTIVLLVVHSTTPYLNHPLGIAWLMFAAATFLVFTSPKHT